MRISLKKIKTNLKSSHDTLYFSADIHFDGKLVARVSNQGWGGNDQVYWVKPDMEKPVMAYATKLEGKLVPLECVVNKLIVKAKQEKQLKQWCKKYTVFQIGNNTDVNNLKMYKVPFNKETKKHIKSKYNDVVFLNEVYGNNA